MEALVLLRLTGWTAVTTGGASGGPTSRSSATTPMPAGSPIPIRIGDVAPADRAHFDSEDAAILSELTGTTSAQASVMLDDIGQSRDLTCGF